MFQLIVGAMVAFWDGIYRFVGYLLTPSSPSEIMSDGFGKAFELGTTGTGNAHKPIPIHCVDYATPELKRLSERMSVVFASLNETETVECRYCGRKYPSGTLEPCVSCGGLL